MAGIHHYHALTSAYPREHLIEQGKLNGIKWEEHSHEGVNWLRFNTALRNHLDNGNDFYPDNAHPEGLKTMLNHYVQLKEMHKQSMVPHVRAAMSKLYSERGNSSDPKSLLQDAYKHLDSNGGHVWSEKVATLHNINTQITKLSNRLKSLGHVTD
jgi:hypothetical protein